MATKAQVLKVLQSQPGVEWSSGHDSSGDFYFEAWLPSGLRWANAQQTGSMYLTKDSSESASSFWASVLYEVDAEVVKE